MEYRKEKQTIVSRDKALEHGVHFGHQPRRWNPAMKPFIHSAMKGTHIINLNRTLSALEFSYKQVSKIAEKGGTFLFVGINKASSKAVKENAIRTGSFYIDHRWLGGTLTNFRTIQNSVNRLRTLERLVKDNFKGYTKKEGIEMKRELSKLERALGGIKYMRRVPSAVIVTSLISDRIAVKEAKKMGIPVFGITDTNTDPSTVNFPIPANDDSAKSVALIITVLADAIAEAKGDFRLAANVSNDKFKVLGIPEFVKQEISEVLSQSAKSRVARTKSDKAEQIEEKETVEVRKEHNEEIELKNEENKATIDYSKLKVVELKDLLKEKDIKFKSTDKKTTLVELANTNV